jgi:hypothetical protein
MLAGCSPKVASQTGFMKERGVEMTSHELRLRNYGLAELFAARVEESADQILQTSSDPVVRENAILWKMHAIPAMQAAAFFGDPLGALVSQIIFCVQMRHYFEHGFGKEALGENQSLAIETSVEIEEVAYKHGKIAVPTVDLDTLRARVNRYARENPIRSPRFKRGTDDPVLASAFTGDETVGGLAAASALNEQIRDLADRMALLTDYGPRQARWQVQYLREQVPGMASVARDTVLAGLTPVMDDLMHFFDLQREHGFDLARSERRAILEAIADERLAAGEILVQERQAAFEQIARERAAIMAELGTILQNSMSETFTRSEATTARMIDHSFRRFTLVMALPFFALVALGIGALIVLDRGLRRR